jgi:RNA recognition motif. (a.k.a. RRM, RBD, or RNP domain)
MSSTDSAKPDDQKKDPPSPSPKVEESEESTDETSKKRCNEEVSSNCAAHGEGTHHDDGDVKASAGTTTLSTTNTSVDEDTEVTATKAAVTAASTKESAEPSPPKKAKIEMTDDVDEYTLDAPPATANTDDSKIETPNIILFGLNPFVKESPLRKMCEHYGTVKTIAVKSTFASRYGHVEYATVEQAKKAYNALNGASLLQKQILVQPTKGAQSS